MFGGGGAPAPRAEEPGRAEGVRASVDLLSPDLDGMDVTPPPSPSAGLEHSQGARLSLGMSLFL